MATWCGMVAVQADAMEGDPLFGGGQVVPRWWHLLGYQLVLSSVSISCHLPGLWCLMHHPSSTPDCITLSPLHASFCVVASQTTAPESSMH